MLVRADGAAEVDGMLVSVDEAVEVDGMLVGVDGAVEVDGILVRAAYKERIVCQKHLSEQSFC